MINFEIRKINFELKNVNELEIFIDSLTVEANSFRYFKFRDINVIKNHIITLLVYENEKPIAYGHLDKEETNIWLGICVLDEYKNRGIGKLIMCNLLDEAKKFKIEKISLTVDKDNLSAQHLYRKIGFIKIENEIFENSYKYIYLVEK